jgi:SAM-dependent methyltransferase
MPETIGQNRFWTSLWKQYKKSPSIAFCRVPELEYASTLDVSGRVLDHCCGDGRFAALAWPGKTLTAGCDIEPDAVEIARKRGNYGRLDVCDVSKKLPYEDGTFDLVFDNSAVEHVEHIDDLLREVARVLASDGEFAFNVLNHRYFEWWPMDETAKYAYQKWQPFYHAWSRETWDQHLAQVGLKITSVDDYLDQQAARDLAVLEYEFSGYYLTHRPSKLVWWYKRLPRLMQTYWKGRLSREKWQTAPDAGAGYFIKARHVHA